MSAIIWGGIVLVWVFVLLPMWVRRGDAHWMQWVRSRTSDGDGSLRRSLHRSRDGIGRAVRGLSRGSSAGRGSAGRPVARRGAAVRRPVQRRRVTQAQRRQRLLALLGLALVTLIAAVVGGGFFVVLQLAADVALVLYVRHLRKLATARRARRARERRALAARAAWEKAAAAERAATLAAWGAQPAATASAASASGEQADEVQPAAAETPVPQVIDLTDAPTEELVIAKAG